MYLTPNKRFRITNILCRHDWFGHNCLPKCLSACNLLQIHEKCYHILTKCYPSFNIFPYNVLLSKHWLVISGSKELSLSHKLKFLYPNLFGFQWRTINCVRSNNLRLNYQDLHHHGLQRYISLDNLSLWQQLNSFVYKQIVSYFFIRQKL